MLIIVRNIVENTYPVKLLMQYVLKMLHYVCLFGFILIVSCKEDFVINNKECLMPNFIAFTAETNATYLKKSYEKCSDLDLLTYTEVRDNRAYLHINLSNLNQYYKNVKDIDCCFQYVFRQGSEEEPDVGYGTTACEIFNTTMMALENDTVLVKCYLGADKIYSNIHRPIIVTADVKRKIKNNNLKRDNNTRPISVLLIVIDSISRLNLERTMPKTRTFLLENGFIEYEGYSKIDDNTFPNFNALLTGLNLGQSNFYCKPEEVGKLDECPMVWYDFRNSGYITAYAEDWASISTYNYLKKGFNNPPTDYYFKPYFEAASDIYQTIVDTMPHCAGPESQGERVLNLARDFAFTFKTQPTFGIFWMNTFSHNYVNTPTRMDKIVRKFFVELKSKGIFDENIVFLLSDHGIRFGEIRKTVQGWYEERLPANLISIPPWFQEAYPEKYENVKRNSKKFTSTFDMYMTLQEVLALSVQNYSISSSKACSTCMSLFSEIPEDRGCREAGVPEAWCTCLGKFDQNDEELTETLINEAMRMTLVYVRNQTSEETVRLIVTKKILSGISRGTNRRKYLLTVFQASDLRFYQAVYRVTGIPLQLVKLVKLTRLY